jgi:hypothetical protein
MNWHGEGVRDWNDARCDVYRYFVCEASP